METEVHDCEDEDLYTFSVVTSTATPNAPRFDPNVVLVTGSTPPGSWLSGVQFSIAALTGTLPVVQSLDDSTPDENKICVFLDDDEQSILSNPNSARFGTMKAFCTRSKGLLWVTHGGTVDCENLEASLNVGFLRSLRAEYVGKRLASLDLDPSQGSWTNESVDTVAKVFQKVFDTSMDEAVKDFEYADRGGVIHIPRYYKDVERNSDVFLKPTTQAVPELAPFDQPHRPLRLGIKSPGLLDTLAFEDDPDAGMELHQDFLEVEPKAFGVNFRDVMVAMGQVQGEAMGFECSGVVSRLGAGAANQGFKIGDRVAMLLRGHYSSKVRLHWTGAVHIPEDMTFEIAASIPMSFTTAYVSLFDMANLRKGESVLIHAASGGFGQAAILLAQSVGAEIFVTVGTEMKRDFIIKRYGIHPDHIFFSRDASFAAGILGATQGRGVDVVLNTLAGALLQESFNCIAPFGRFIEVGKRDLELNSSLEMRSFARNASFSHIDLLMLGEHRGIQIHRVLTDVMRLFEAKTIRPVDPITTYPISDVEKTFRLMQAGKHTGKIVLSVKPDDLVPVSPLFVLLRVEPI